MVDRPSYLFRIDEALHRRGEAEVLVREGLHEANGRISHSLKKALGKLSNTTNAEEFLSNKELARFLPILMASVRNDTPRMKMELRKIASEERLLLPPSLAYRWGRFVPFFILMLIVFYQAHFVTPVFEEMFRDFQMKLNPTTSWMLAFNSLIRNHGLVCLVILAIPFFFWPKIIRLVSSAVGYLQRFPSIELLTTGRKTDLVSMGRLVANFAELLELQAPAHDAIRYAGVASDHPFYKRYSERLSHQSTDLRTLSSSATRLPLIITQTILAPESEGNRSSFLRDVAHVYSNRACLVGWDKSDASTPWAILSIGILIGYLYINLFLPFNSLITALA